MQMFCPFTHPGLLFGTKCKPFFSEEGYFAYPIMQLKFLTLCTPLAFWAG